MGSYPRLFLADARESARKIMMEARDDVLPEPEEEYHQITLGEVIPQFIGLYAKPKNRNWRESERILNQKFIALLDVPVRDIRRPDIVRILDSMVAAGIPGRANHAMAAIKKLFNWSVDRGYIDINPIAGLAAPGKKTARERVLTDVEIQRLLAAASEEGYRPSRHSTKIPQMGRTQS